MMPVVTAPPERAVRVSTLELFFDLVFVFTITQLTGVLVEGQDAAALLQVVVMLLLIGGALGANWQWVLWAVTAGLLWVTPHLTTTEGFVVAVSHFVERHGLVVIVALGESIVVIGVGAAGLPLDAGLVLVALLSLALSAALWWIYFSDETAVEDAFHAAAPQRRAPLG